jgi:prepilin-type N-terminal cleavage/methylation domain-containing protein
MSRRGFTLIELLLVVVILGILAAIAIPKFVNTKEKAYVASMKTDLRNLITAEEAYFSDYYTYTSTTADLPFTESPGVTVTIDYNPGRGWTATAGHTATLRTCEVWIAPGNGQGTGVTGNTSPVCP